MSSDSEYSQSSWRLNIRNVGREISDDGWEHIEPGFLETIEKAQNYYRDYRVELKDGIVGVCLNFEPYRYEMEHNISVMKRIINNKEMGALKDFNLDEIILSIFTYTNDSKCISIQEEVLEFSIYECFLTFNLADPGVLGFFGSALSPDPPQKGYRGKEYKREIGLHGRLFEVALYEQEKHSWLKPSRIDVGCVIRWVRRQCSPEELRPKNSAAKALFALLRISRVDIDPTALIWVFYALETLFQCKPGENFATLNRRISAFLNLNAQDAADLKRRLRRLYDHRSALVHGGAYIAHPLETNSIDQDAMDASWEFQKAVDFGASLVVICIQNLIINDANDLVFEEIIKYNR